MIYFNSHVRKNSGSLDNIWRNACLLSKRCKIYVAFHKKQACLGHECEKYRRYVQTSGCMKKQVKISQGFAMCVAELKHITGKNCKSEREG